MEQKKPKRPAWQRVEEVNLAAARLLLATGAGGLSREWALAFLARYERWQERNRRRTEKLASESVGKVA